MKVRYSVTGRNQVEVEERAMEVAEDFTSGSAWADMTLEVEVHPFVHDAQSEVPAIWEADCVLTTLNREVWK